MTNARFKVSRGTVLTLEPGDSLVHRSGGATDEGFEFMEKVWAYDGEHLFLETYRSCRDCDGPLEQWRQFIADPPASGESPRWELVTGRNRDVFAEMMGY